MSKIGIVTALTLFIVIGCLSFLLTQKSLVTQPAISVTNNVTAPILPPSSQPITLLFGGDLMFDRDIRLAMNKHGVDFIFSELTLFFNTFDLVVANLEGPVTTNDSVSVGSAPGSPKNFSFTFNPNILPMLQKNNLKLLNLGNNHITNFGISGVNQTKELLTQNQLSFFGNTGTETSPNERISIQKINNHTIAFVNHNQFVPDGFSTALEDLAYANQNAELVIVMTHWGNEYQPEATGVIVEQAHQLVEAGADLIIGTHPHVVQQSEIYLGTTIYYSLGNMVFDQYFSAETMQGLLVAVTITFDNQSPSLTFTEFPITIQRNGQILLTQ